MAIRLFLVLILMSGILAITPFFASNSQAQTAGATGSLGQSGLLIPRFVSLKSNRVNVRGGPSQDHSIAWVFLQQGLPVEIVAEFENWRQVRDSDGEEGWIFHSLLSARRTILVAPWSEDEFLILRDRPDESGTPVVKLSPGILCDLDRCVDGWCQISIRQYEGWIKQELLFGTYPDEAVN